MSGNSYFVHGGWALAVLVAFGLGSTGRAPESSEATGSAAAPKSQRSAANSALSGPEGPGSRGESRAVGARGTGMVERIFGASSPTGDDWEALARQAMRDPNPIARRLAFARLLETLTPDNAQAMREQLVAFGADGREWNDFNYAWGALAGEEAFTFAADSEERDLASVLTGWAAARPDEALALLDNLPERLRGQRDELAESVVRGLAQNDAGLATDLVMRLSAEGNERAGNLILLVADQSLRTGGPGGAAAWSEGLPDGKVKASAMDRVADAWARRDPQAAADWVEPLAGEDFAARAVEEVADGWARRNPAEAVGWLEDLPAGGGQSRGLRSVFGDWEDRDPVAAGEYLMQMSPSAQRDAAISGFSSGYAWQDPEVAIAWAEDISDPALRRESLTRAGWAFFRRDPNGARTWLESSGLPPEVQERVLNPPRRR